MGVTFGDVDLSDTGSHGRLFELLRTLRAGRRQVDASGTAAFPSPELPAHPSLQTFDPLPPPQRNPPPNTGQSEYWPVLAHALRLVQG